MEKTVPKSKPLWHATTFRLALLAAVFTAVYKTMDNVTVHNFITSTDGLTAAFAYLIIGSWTGLIASLVFALLFGKKVVDPDFSKLEINRRIVNKEAILSGTISAGSTLFLLWGNQLGDPSVLIALGNGVILYTAFYDVITKQVKFDRIVMPVLFVLFGGMMAAFCGSLQITLLGILFVLVISNGLAALSEVVEQAGTRKSDGVNFFVWRFFWLATTGTVLAITVSFLRGYQGLLLKTLSTGVMSVPWITLTMLFVFLGIGMKLVAKKRDAVTVVLIVFSAQIVLSYPITIAGNWLFPGVFGKLPQDLWVWIIRLVGSGLMIIGINHLRKKNIA